MARHRSTQRALAARDTLLPPDLRAALEGALSALRVDGVDVEAADPDAEAAPPVRLQVFGSEPAGVRSEPGIIAVTFGENSRGGLLRLTPCNVGAPTPRWLSFLPRLGDALHRPGLADFAGTDGDGSALLAWALQYPGNPLARERAADMEPDALMDMLAPGRLREARLASALHKAQQGRL